jgi:hypothetical protein
MGIESTRIISRTEAIDKIKGYLSIKLNIDNILEKSTNDELDKLLHKLKYELDVDIFDNYIIKD